MTDCVFWLALAFLLGMGVGVLLTNEVIWRGNRREFERMRRDMAESSAHWDAEMAKLKAARGVE